MVSGPERNEDFRRRDTANSRRPCRKGGRGINTLDSASLFLHLSSWDSSMAEPNHSDRGLENSSLWSLSFKLLGKEQGGESWTLDMAEQIETMWHRQLSWGYL